VIDSKENIMRLSDWLKREEMSGAEFARRTGLSEGMVSLLCRDATWLSQKTAQTIRDATGGDVTPNDFLPIEAAQ